MNRWRDWWRQAERDLGHAEHSVAAGDYEWACFAAHQAGEKALKAVLMAAGGDPWGHLLTALLEAFPDKENLPGEVREAASRLDKHYLPTRYPNGFPEGFPGGLYTLSEAETAIDDARTLHELCRRRLPRT